MKKILIIIGIVILFIFGIFIISELTNNVFCKPRLAGHNLYICPPSLYEKLFSKSECLTKSGTVTLKAFDKNKSLNLTNKK